MRKYEAEVREGIKYLDEHAPVYSWRDKVDLETLDMGLTDKDILYQVYGMRHREHMSRVLGFYADDTDELNAEWKRQLVETVEPLTDEEIKKLRKLLEDL